MFGCCSWGYEEKEFEFTQEEFNHFGPYKVGDTVYFESNLGNIDTIAVLQISEAKEEGSKCFISRAPSHHRTITIKHLPYNNWLGPTIIQEGKRKIYCQDIISISKYPLKKQTVYDISFKGFHTATDSVFNAFQPMCQVGRHRIENCYKITHSYPDRITQPDNIEVVYWTDKFGLTAYTSKSGETWLITGIK